MQCCLCIGLSAAFLSVVKQCTILLDLSLYNLSVGSCSKRDVRSVPCGLGRWTGQGMGMLNIESHSELVYLGCNKLPKFSDLKQQNFIILTVL